MLVLTGLVMVESANSEGQLQCCQWWQASRDAFAWAFSLHDSRPSSGQGASTGCE